MNVSSSVRGAEVDDLLKQLDNAIGQEPAGDHSDVRDASDSDERTSPVVSPIDKPRDQEVKQSELRLPAHPPAPPSSPTSPKHRPTTPPRKKRGIVTRALDKLKKIFMKKFERGDQAPHRLSDKLAPERNDEHKGYGELFSKSPRPTISRK